MASRHRGVGAEDHQASYDQPAWGRATKAWISRHAGVKARRLFPFYRLTCYPRAGRPRGPWEAALLVARARPPHTGRLLFFLLVWPPSALFNSPVDMYMYTAIPLQASTSLPKPKLAWP